MRESNSWIKPLFFPSGESLLGTINQGIGISEEFLDVLFNTDSTIKNRAGTDEELSTGLGLSVTKQIVKLFEGTISVDSWVV